MRRWLHGAVLLVRLRAAPSRHRRQPRPEYQAVTDDGHRLWLPETIFAAQPPFAAFPVGDLRRLLAEHDPVKSFLARFWAVTIGCPHWPLSRALKNFTRTRLQQRKLGANKAKGETRSASRGAVKVANA